METIRVGVIMNGVTGRMGTNQHLVRSIDAIRAQGGVALADGRRVMPDPILVGRNAAKVEALARAHGVSRWTTNLDAALADRNDSIYFDSASTGLRAQLIGRRSTRASTSTPKNRLRPRSRTRSICIAARSAPAFATASCRTSCGCRACGNCSC